MNEGKLLKSKLNAGDICLGTWVHSTDPTVVELLCGSGFDFIVLDSEHGPLDIQTVQQGVMATKGTAVTPIVRVAWNDLVLIKRVLDVGAGGVIVPLVRTAEDARDAVSACMYPPVGVRGYGPRRPTNYGRSESEYIASANDDIVIWTQIEHIDAVNNITDILAVPGLAGALIGRNDLSGSMGLLGQPGHPDVLAAIDRVIAAGTKAGVPVGIVSSADPQAAADWVSKGIRFVTLDSSDGFLVSASEAAVSGVRDLLA